MKTDSRIPTQTIDVYWIYTYYSAYQFKKEKAERASGKWLIFEYVKEVDATWKKIEMATLKGLLGPSAKVSTAKPNPNAFDERMKVICVYTEDFNNKLDIDRIAKVIRSLGIDNKLIYKLDRDIGKYHKDGFTNLSQEVRYSRKYEEVVAWLIEHPHDKYIRFIGQSKTGKNRYRFRRLEMTKAVFNQKIRQLKKLGFFFDYKCEIEDEEVVFLIPD